MKNTIEINIPSISVELLHFDIFKLLFYYSQRIEIISFFSV